LKIELISLVIPCYNEEATVEELYHRAKALADAMVPRKFEFIFVNDCSTDATGSTLNDLAHKNPDVKVLHLAQNRGQQIALTAGMDHAVGEVVVTIDADLQHPPELIRDMVKKIEEGYDIVYAQRQRRTGDTWFKLLTAKLFYYFMRYFSGVRLIENCGDFRAFTRPVLEAVKSFRMHYRFLRGIFVQVGFHHCVVTYVSEVRFAGATKYSFLKMMNLAIDGVLGFSAAPIRFITWLSLLLWSVSLVHLIKSLIEYFILKITVSGWTSIIVLMFFFTGLILFSIAIIGSYVGRIFVQGQNIPLYWLRDARNLDPVDIKERAGEVSEVKLSQRILKAQR
jgi:glycosyltransferase involved in cell wall biosynthesis